MNRRILLCTVLLLITIVPITASAHRRGMNVSVNNGEDATSCEQLKISFDGQPAKMQTQDLSVAKAEANPLRLNTDWHGGIVLYGTSRGDYGVKACKASKDQNMLSSIQVSAANGEVKVKGPEPSDDWMVYFIIAAPQDANVDFKAVNSPISIRDVSGRVIARTTNGPIEVKNSSGTIDAQAVNGPVAFRGSSGDVTLRAQNGPIDIDIESSKWQGAKLDAFTENGPVELHIPAQFESAAVVETSNHSPFDCSASACGSARRTWTDNTRRVEFGSATPAVVKVANVNGPISIVDHKAKM